MVLAAYVFLNYCRSYKELSESLLDCFASGGVSLTGVGLVHCLRSHPTDSWRIGGPYQNMACFKGENCGKVRKSKVNVR